MSATDRLADAIEDIVTKSGPIALDIAALLRQVKSSTAKSQADEAALAKSRNKKPKRDSPISWMGSSSQGMNDFLDIIASDSFKAQLALRNITITILNSHSPLRVSLSYLSNRSDT